MPIALTAAGQALLVRSAQRRQRLLRATLSRTPRLLHFLLLAGPAGCWPAAASYFETALRNLLLNASHAAGEQGVIRLGVEIDGPDLIVRVEDSGAGFLAAQTLSRIETRLASSW